MKQEYEMEESTLYQETITYIKKNNPDVTYKLLSFLLKFEPHQTIENYLNASEYLTRGGKGKEAIRLLEEGLGKGKNKSSVELKTQLNYLKTLAKNKGLLGVKINKNLRNDMKKDDEEIFYSDNDEDKKEEES